MCIKTTLMKNVRRDSDYGQRAIVRVWLKPRGGVITAVAGNVFKIYDVCYEVDGVRNIQYSRIEAILSEVEVLEAESLGYLK